MLVVLALVGLAGFDDRHPRDLSSGERERLGLAAVLVTEPDLPVLDEPTRGMDPERKLELAALLRAQAEERATLVVTHDLVFAAEVADRIVTTAPGTGAGPCSRSALLACAAVAFAAAVWTALSPQDAALSLLLVAVALVLSGFVWLEAGTGSAKEVALVAVLGGAAAAGRVLFAAVPGVQPVTVVAVAAGAALGARVGFAVGAVAALVSNFYLGQGIWTPWQMLAWGGCGVVGALAAGLIRNRWAFAALCFALGFAFSSAMDPLVLVQLLAPHLGGADARLRTRDLVQRLPRGRQHRLRGRHRPELRRLLERYGRRLRVEVAWA